MRTPARCRHLAQQIRACLHESIRIGPRVQVYIDSTCGETDGPMLQQILTDGDDAGHASVAALVFSPDAAFQARIEPTLAAQPFAPADVHTVTALLCRPAPPVCIRWPERNIRLKIDMPHPCIAPFISQLNITRTPDPELAAAIEKHLEPDFRTTAAVGLRNTRYPLTPEKKRFLNKMFATIGADADFPSCFALVLELLDETATVADVKTVLIDKKRFYFKALQISKAVSARLEKGNVETLMLQGARIPCIDPLDCRHRMRLIDRLCRSIYGQTVYFETADAVIAGDVCTGAGDAHRIIQRFGQ